MGNLKRAAMFYSLPNWLYNALPYAYFVIGVVVMLDLANAWAIFSGTIWILTGVLVFAMRRAQRQAVPDGKVGDDNIKTLKVATGASGSVQLIWSRAYECGNSGVDAQHQKLFRTANALVDAIHTGRSQSDVTALIDKLLKRVKAHFSSEEALLATWDHPLTEEHKQVHQQLLEKAVELREKSIKGGLSFQDVFSFFVNDLVLKHMLEDDKKFSYQV